MSLLQKAEMQYDSSHVNVCRIASLGALQPLKSLHNLQELSLDGNPISKAHLSHLYRKYVLELCPSKIKVFDAQMVSLTKQYKLNIGFTHYM